ncbi:riboflavin synthase [Campylobacter sp. FMV-PI01]|uniref:Riboflavin synthase n=1 Tax=Campylobacter portucalensis TaxID=2608384 RepID=A0A6L5WK11_9BACT|nr:riboflavin synthase [Campylobacter portucalensis]MSN96355.1 riboflavin synthase [Campylobacter portucalensis]
MFNGLIKEISQVVNFDGKILTLKSNLNPNLGDSIAINGACLSVISKFNGGFSVEVSSESVKNLAIENFKDFVHSEEALKFGDKIDGHLIQGHIDFIGEIYKISELKTGFDFYIKLPSQAMKFVANKGSIAVDGVSLTINEILDNAIRLTIISITMRDTLFGRYKVGRRVNIETDLLARYVARALNLDKKGLSWEDVERISSLY